MNPGIAQGSINIVRQNFFIVTPFELINMAKNMPVKNAVTDDTTAHTTVHSATPKNVRLKDGNLNRFMKLSNPTQSTRFLGER